MVKFPLQSPFLRFIVELKKLLDFLISHLTSALHNEQKLVRQRKTETGDLHDCYIFSFLLITTCDAAFSDTPWDGANTDIATKLGRQ